MSSTACCERKSRISRHACKPVDLLAHVELDCLIVSVQEVPVLDGQKKQNHRKDFRHPRLWMDPVRALRRGRLRLPLVIVLCRMLRLQTQHRSNRDDSYHLQKSRPEVVRGHQFDRGRPDARHAGASGIDDEQCREMLIELCNKYKGDHDKLAVATRLGVEAIRASKPSVVADFANKVLAGEVILQRSHGDYNSLDLGSLCSITRGYHR